LGAAVAADPDAAPLHPRSRALVDFALSLTRSPGAIAEESLSPLRAAGVTDRGVHDAVNVIAYFNYVNRVALGLGVELESGA